MGSRVFAMQAVEAAQSSLDLASRLVQRQPGSRRDRHARADRHRHGAGRRGDPPAGVGAAQATLRTAELALKRLIVSGTEDPLWTSSINPVDRPSIDAGTHQPRGGGDPGAGARTDLQQSKNNLRISDINLRNQVDLTRPQLNLQAAYGLSGLGGPFLQRTGAVDPITGGRSAT